jgi:hypothetical protein
MTKPLDIPMPDISSDFTIEDIHKIREWNYERRKLMTAEDRCADVNESAARFQKRMEERRRTRPDAQA